MTIQSQEKKEICQQTRKGEMFEEELKYTTGIDFQIVAFPACNGETVGDTTSHHALGLHSFGARKITGMKKL